MSGGFHLLASAGNAGWFGPRRSRIGSYARAMRLSTEADRFHEAALSPWVSGTVPMWIVALGLLVLLLVCLVLGALAILLMRIRKSSSETSSDTSRTT